MCNNCISTLGYIKVRTQSLFREMLYDSPLTTSTETNYSKVILINNKKIRDYIQLILKQNCKPQKEHSSHAPFIIKVFF